MATNDPFGSVSFGGEEAPSVSNDDITRVLLSLNPKALTQVQGGTDAGINRVNANMGRTGAAAYKDNKGQAVLTNMAIDPSGQERPIAALLRPAAEGNTNPNFVAGEARPALFDAYKKLQKATTAEEAEAIYSGFLETTTAEATRMENEAFKFAENKFGIAEIQRQLNEARQADKADPMFAPGMGDSPITAKIVDDLRQLSLSATEDAKGFLKRNMSYNSLAVLKTNAEREYQRIQKQVERKANFESSVAASREGAEIQRNAQQAIRKEDRLERREEEASKIYNSLTPTQIGRLTMLHSVDIAGIDNEKERRIKIADLATGSIKDKKLQEAVSAETDDQLVQYAIAGNGVATKLVVMEEAMRTGKSTQDVEEMLRKARIRMNDQRLAPEVLNRMKMSSQERGEKLALLNTAMFDLNPNRKAQADALRTQLVMEDIKYQVQQRYLNDVSSWGSTEPTMLAAIDKAKKVSGKADIKSVVSSFVGDAVAEDRKNRLAEFNKMLKNAALKQQTSMFGTPNWREAEALTVRQIVDLNLFTGTMKNLHDMGLGSMQGRKGMASGHYGMFPAILELADQAANKFTPNMPE